MAAQDLLDRAEWRRRSEEFGAVRTYNDGRPIVVMEFEPTDPDRVDEWIWLRHLWLDLPPHAHVLDAIDRGTGAKLLLRYAAINWRTAPLGLETAKARQLVATWGAQLTAALRQILSDIPETEVGHFLRPLVKIDLVGDAQVAFLPIALTDPHLPPDAQTSWPQCDERVVVHTIGGVIGDYCVGLDAEVAEPIKTIVQRCLQPQPSDRYQRLEDLQAAWAELAYTGLEGDWLTAWKLAQEGIGWLEVGQPNPVSVSRATPSASSAGS